MTNLKKLMKFIKRRRLKLRVNKKYGKNNGFYVPDKKQFLLGKFDDIETLVYCLLHEIGHYLCHKIYGRDYKLDNIYYKINKLLPLKKEEKKLVVINEKIAWILAEVIATKLNIRLSKGFHRMKTTSLKSYRNY